jgi:hypothetical protein
MSLKRGGKTGNLKRWHWEILTREEEFQKNKLEWTKPRENLVLERKF